MLITILSLLLGCSSTKRVIKKNNYPPEYRAQFIADCLSSGSSLEMCECSADGIMKTYPSDQVIGVEFTPELATQIANIGVRCMPLHEIRAQMISGCPGQRTSALECECSVNTIVDQYTQEEMASILIARYSGYIPPEFLKVREDSEVSCMSNENLKNIIITSCHDGNDLEYCECVYEKMQSNFGEDQLKRIFVKIRSGDPDAESSLFDFLRVAKEACSVVNIPETPQPALGPN